MSEYNLNFEQAITAMREGKIVEKCGTKSNGIFAISALKYKMLDECLLFFSNQNNSWDKSTGYVEELLNAKFKIVEPEPVLNEVKFYKVFDSENGGFSSFNYSKNGEDIENFRLVSGGPYFNERITNELAYTAYFSEKNEVVKYVLPSGEEIVVWANTILCTQKIKIIFMS